MLWNRFRAWLQGPELAATEQSIRHQGVTLSEHSTQLRAIGNLLIDLNNAVVSLAEREPDHSSVHPMVPEMLMAFDAVTFAVEKFDKDPIPDVRLMEILKWSKVYLQENRWEIPPDSILVWLLERRDLINSQRLVGRFN